jgi:hypothetical protein
LLSQLIGQKTERLVLDRVDEGRLPLFGHGGKQALPIRPASQRIKSIGRANRS